VTVSQPEMRVAEKRRQTTDFDYPIRSEVVAGRGDLLNKSKLLLSRWRAR
jgi:hypothetical protein